MSLGIDTPYGEFRDIDAMRRYADDASDKAERLRLEAERLATAAAWVRGYVQAAAAFSTAVGEVAV